MTGNIFGKGYWALVLGASSGFGEATALELSRQGMNIFGVHLDRKATMPNVERIIKEIQSMGSEAVFFNINAADPKAMDNVILEIQDRVSPSPGGVSVLLHSLAFGTLKPFIGEDVLNPSQLDMTLNVMANSLVFWTQKLVSRHLFLRGGRVFAMTSSGSNRVLPAYGGVSAAKCALESHCRQLAMELAPLAITANSIRAGVTDTPALRKIPGNEVIIEKALSHNPYGRLTTPADVAQAIAALCDPRAHWINGNVINVDGGEEMTG